MRRRTFLKSSLATGLALAVPPLTASNAEGLKPPNILWLSAEDISPDLGCYGDAYATSPNIDAFAQRAIRYERAYSHSGVCAPSRSGIITGMYPTSIGTQHMRCSGIPPAGVKCFPEYLRAAGYYCTNNSKTDYQFESPLSAWDENSKTAHWKNRPENAPFFSVFNFVTSHEGQVRSHDADRLAELEALGTLRHDPDKVALPPYHADTPATRKDWAQYYDLITLMDREVGAALADLEEAGLAEDTIVWFWGDHGRGLTRCKRWLYESGTRVPLLIHVPEKYRAWVRPDAPESLSAGVCDDLVCFVDFAPTMLSLADVALPSHFQGQPFLGKTPSPARNYVYGARDRMDEACDCIRTVRDKQYRYFRNYMPWLTYAQRIEYMDEMPMAQDLRRLHAEGKLNADQERWFAPRKPLEELYDVDADPHELHDLASDPRHAEILARFQQAHQDWAESTEDTGLIPEPLLDGFKWPGGHVPKCAAPSLDMRTGQVTLACGTAGASINYRWDDMPKGVWKLYTEPIQPRKEHELTVRGTRIGFVDSPDVTTRMEWPKAERAMEEAPFWLDEIKQRGLLKKLRAFRALDFDASANLPTYLESLGDKEANLRYWSIVALHRMANGRTKEASWESALEPLLSDPEATVRVAAAQALAEWGQATSALPVLEKVLIEGTQSERLYAAIALAELGDIAQPAWPTLERAKADPWNYVQRVIEQILAASPQGAA